MGVIWVLKHPKIKFSKKYHLEFNNEYSVNVIQYIFRNDYICFSFLPCCVERNRGLATRKLSVCPSVRLSVCQTHGL